ncbi:MAG: alcohol dehydrogenase catalytic domain-containing protein, partial [Candidatus Latescibacterota bacterium]
MKAMVLNRVVDLNVEQAPLTWMELPDPVPGPNDILLKVSACGVCRTELDEIEGRTPPSHYPMIPGHQVVGHVAQTGDNARAFACGDRAGIAWIYSACGACAFCADGNENLCPHFQATGRDAAGGYAQFITVREDYAHRIPDRFSDAQAAPL